MGKVVLFRRAAVSRLALLCDLPHQVAEWTEKTRGRWVASVRVGWLPVPQQDARLLASDGWDGSFHDAHYRPVCAATGRTPARARRALRRLLASLTRDAHASVRRHQMRNLVRNGD